MKKGFWRNKEKEWGITKENSVDFLLLDREDKNKKIKFIKLFLDFIFFIIISFTFCQESWSKFLETLLNVVSCPFLFPYQPSFNSQVAFF